MHSFLLGERRTKQRTKMEDRRIATNREEMEEMLATALDQKGVPRHRNQPEEISMEIGDPQTSVMTTCKSILYIILINLL